MQSRKKKTWLACFFAEISCTKEENTFTTKKKLVFLGRYENRTINESLDLAWELLRTFPRTALKKIKKEIVAQYFER